MGDVSRKLAPVVNGVPRVICCHSATLTGRFAPNSLRAVNECVEAGVPRFEIDLQFLADDAMLVFHDASFDGSTTTSGRVADARTEFVRDIIYKSGEPLCFFDDVVGALEGSETILQVDLKLSRPMSERRRLALQEAIRPLGDRVMVGSQSHWNLRALEVPRIALDPTLHWAFAKSPPGIPHTMGVHGLWDDSPIAGNARFTAMEYLEARMEDIHSILPNASEWMVDFGTVLKMGELGMNLGEALRRRGCALAAWTIHRDVARPRELLQRLFGLGVETVITDVPELVGDWVL